jgi:hypothetical protein
VEIWISTAIAKPTTQSQPVMKSVSRSRNVQNHQKHLPRISTAASNLTPVTFDRAWHGAAWLNLTGNTPLLIACEIHRPEICRLSEIP